MRGRRIVLALALATGCLVVSVAQASTASAHAQIVSSTPADGTNLTAAPRTLTLVLSEAVELRYTKITLTDGQGRPTVLSGLRIGEPQGGSRPAEQATGAEQAASGAGSGAEEETPVTITADLPALEPDLYHVAWSTVSSDDLHATSGVLVFGVQTAVPPRAAQPSDPLPAPGEVTLRWVGLVGVGGATGAALLWLLLARRRRGDDEPLRALALPMVGGRLLSLAALGATVGGAADLARLVVQAHVAGGGWLAPTAHLLAGNYGARWAGREVAAVGIIALALRARQGRTEPSTRDRTRIRGRMVLGIVALSGLYALAVTLTGHAGAGAARHPVRIAVESAHVTAAMAWVGALVTGSLVLWRPVAGHPARGHLARATIAQFRRLVLARFGIVAASCLAVMITTGLLLARSGVASADALLMSTYGRLLLVKLLLVGLALSAAAATALSVHPHLLPRRAAVLVRALPLRLLLTMEALAAVAVVLAAAALGSARPAVGPAWAAAPTVQPLVSGTAGDLVETVHVAPNRPGRNFVTADVFDSRRPMLAPIGSVQVTLTGPDGVGTSAVATAQGNGRWLLATDAMTTGGRWSVDLAVARPGLPVSVQRYGWVVSDPTLPNRRTVASDQPLAPTLTHLAEGVAGFAALAGLIFGWRQTRGRRSRTSAPPSGASPTDTSPLNVAETAATSASPSPVPGSSPGGWR